MEDTVILNDVINKALKNRPDLIALERQEAKLDLDNAYNTLSKYPKLNVFAYGVHDLQYGEGVKVGFQFEIFLSIDLFVVIMLLASIFRISSPNFNAVLILSLNISLES